MSERWKCQRPDRDALVLPSGKVRGLVCGHPLPCPHHTAMLAQERIHVPGEGLDAGQFKRLGEVRRAIFDDEQGDPAAWNTRATKEGT